MRLTPESAAEVVNHWAAELDGGSLTILGAGGLVLCRVRFRDPAFEQALNGRTLARETEAATIVASGEPVSGELRRADSQLIAMVNIRTNQDTQAERESADILIRRPDTGPTFQRGGLFTLNPLLLTFPIVST